MLAVNIDQDGLLYAYINCGLLYDLMTKTVAFDPLDGMKQDQNSDFSCLLTPVLCRTNAPAMLPSTSKDPNVIVVLYPQIVVI